jgi:hypothetical protein
MIILIIRTISAKLKRVCKINNRPEITLMHRWCNEPRKAAGNHEHCSWILIVAVLMNMQLGRWGRGDVMSWRLNRKCTRDIPI